MLRYVDEEEPIEFDLAPWQVCCYHVPDIITALNDIHFIALHAAEDFQLGADLLFWHQYSQAIKGIIAKDQYIPALKYQAISSTPTKGKRAKNIPSFELHHAWELLSDTYETTIQHYVAAMPGACTAGLNSPDDAALFDKEIFAPPLLRVPPAQHCHWDALYWEIRPADREHTPVQVRVSKSTGSCASLDDELEDYKHWLAWRANFTRAHTEAGFTLCFRLEEASSTDIDNWHLHFLVAARHDPSLKLSLDDYWHLDAAGPRRGYPALSARTSRKIYCWLWDMPHESIPQIWDGMATDHPTGCRLTLDEAFAFLKESAWVLGDAGYTVIVPAWWTPQGRRRTKVRLKTSLRSPKGAHDQSWPLHASVHIISYEYQLSVGGQVVTEEEWQQLVNAKTPLVQFRGQWMELDRDKMQQLLQFWQTHQHEEPEITLLDMLKIGTEAEDDLEWDHDQSCRTCCPGSMTRMRSPLLKIHRPCREPCVTTRGVVSPGSSTWKTWV